MGLTVRCLLMVTAQDPATGLRIPGTIGLKDLVPLLLILYLSNRPAIPWYGYVSMFVLSVALFVWANWSDKTELSLKAIEISTTMTLVYVYATKFTSWYVLILIYAGVSIVVERIRWKIAGL